MDCVAISDRGGGGDIEGICEGMDVGWEGRGRAGSARVFRRVGGSVRIGGSYISKTGVLI